MFQHFQMSDKVRLSLFVNLNTYFNMHKCMPPDHRMVAILHIQRKSQINQNTGVHFETVIYNKMKRNVVKKNKENMQKYNNHSYPFVAAPVVSG